MAGYIEITDGLRHTYTRVLPAGEGVCKICHSQPGHGMAICSSCEYVMRRLSRPVGLVVPISLSEGTGALHHSLKYYKSDDTPEFYRQKYRREIAALLHRFVKEHRGCIAAAAGADWDVVTIVPSTSGRTGVHPFEDVLQVSRFLFAEYRALLVRSAVEVAPRQPHDSLFEVTEPVHGRSILILDDTFTSGARSESAASALQLAGATVVGIVPVARYMNPEYSAELLVRARQMPFDFDRCCLDQCSV